MSRQANATVLYVLAVEPVNVLTYDIASCKAAGELCNLLAMTFLQKEDYSMATELLKKAEILTENEPGGRAVTYNNLACFARQQGRLHAALAYLQKALRIEESLALVETPADTHLNLCAVLSQLGKHPEALQHGIAALTLLQDELFSDATAASSAAQKPDRVAVLAICYHNIGVEYEFLKDWEAAAQAYTKGESSPMCPASLTACRVYNPWSKISVLQVLRLALCIWAPSTA